LGGVRLASIFVFSGLLLGAGFYWYADRTALAMVGARELPQAEAPTFHSTVERLSLRARVVKPRLYLVEHGPPLALASGRGPGSSSIAVTTALLGLVAPAEVEGVLAHEIAHVRNRDVLVQTTAVVIAALLVEASRVGGFLQRALLFVLGPVAAAFIHLLLSSKRELEADRLAAEICDSPHGLADALIRLEQAVELVEFRASPATEPLYTLNPFLEEGLAGLFTTHPPVAERVARLRNLDPTWREKLRAA
jgi:heat shock protein HtpX